MASTVFYDAYVLLNAVDVSAQVKSVTLPQEIVELDATTMGSAATTIHEPGLKSFSFEIEFNADFTDNELDEDLFTLWDARTKFPLIIRVNKTTVIGVANPEYRCASVFIKSYQPVGGTVGDLVSFTLGLSNAAVLTRHTA